MIENDSPYLKIKNKKKSKNENERGKAVEKVSGRDPRAALCVVYRPPGLFRGECMSAPFLGSERKGENKMRRKREVCTIKGMFAFACV